MLELSDDTRERLLAPLEKAILDIEMRRRQNGQTNTPNPDHIDDDAIDDIDDVNDNDIDDVGEAALDELDDVAAMTALATTT